MRRKAVIKSKATTKIPGLSKLAGVAHFHFCANRECRLIYEDNCDTPEENILCRPCRGLRRSTHDAYRDPQICCIDNCDQVTDRRELNINRLAGPGPWFQCKKCARRHGWPCTLS